MFSRLKQLSTKVKILLVVTVLFVLTAWIIALNSKNSFSYAQPGSDIASLPKLTLDSLAEKDTDGDEIPYWEEALWGTDPNKTETTIGLLDKNYVEKRRKEIQSQTGVTAEDVASNDTDKFSQDFLKTIVSLKQSGNLNQASIDAISKTIGQDMTGKIIPSQYNIKDLSIVTKTNANIKKYMDQIEGIIIKYGNMDKGPGKEMAIFGDALQNEDESKKVELEKIGDLYISMAKELIKVGVPTVLSQDHLNLANYTAQTGLAIKNMSQSFTNPILGIAGISQYYTYSEKLDIVFDKIETYFDDNDII